MKKLLFYLKWIIKCKFAGEKIPLSSSIIITDKCNLTCKHCSVAHLGYNEQNFNETIHQISQLYELGSRMLVITGGEPFIWSDNEKTLDDVVKFSKQLGFFRVVICTNGTYPLESSADYLWVSMDGSEGIHDNIRGNIAKKVWDNIIQSKHKNIYINLTISKLNKDTFADDSKQILQNKKIKGILFHIFTPYIGSDSSITLSDDEKKNVFKKTLKLKMQHPIRVSNTYDGIKQLIKDKWKRPIWSSILINQGKISTCCCREDIYNSAVCKTCGCSPAVETYVLEKMKPLAIIENFRFL